MLLSKHADVRGLSLLRREQEPQTETQTEAGRSPKQVQNRSEGGLFMTPSASGPQRGGRKQLDLLTQNPNKNKCKRQSWQNPPPRWFLNTTLIRADPDTRSAGLSATITQLCLFCPGLWNRRSQTSCSSVTLNTPLLKVFSLQASSEGTFLFLSSTSMNSP